MTLPHAKFQHPLPLPGSHAGYRSWDILCLAISGYLFLNADVLRNLSSLFSIPESGGVSEMKSTLILYCALSCYFCKGFVYLGKICYVNVLTP